MELYKCYIRPVELFAREMLVEVRGAAKHYPIVTITGPRQSGKTTLARMAFADRRYESLENPDTRLFAQDDPRGFLKRFAQGGGIIDEVQRVPELLSFLQTLVDQRQRMGDFILTGSSQFELIEAVTQSLAGRTSLLKLLPLSFEELEPPPELMADADHWMLHGFFPAVHQRKQDPTKAYRNYVETYLSGDVRQIANVRDLRLFQRFMRLCAGRVGQLLNMTALANEVGVSQTTIGHWLSVLEASYVLYTLQPFHESFNKRQVKTPKLYFYDVGLASYLLGIETTTQLSRDPLRGALFENMVLNEIIKKRMNRGLDANVFFFRDNHGFEVDVLQTAGQQMTAIEIKSAATFHPRFALNLKKLATLVSGRWQLARAALVCAVDEPMTYHDISVLPFASAASLVAPERDPGR